MEPHVLFIEEKQKIWIQETPSLFYYYCNIGIVVNWCEMVYDADGFFGFIYVNGCFKWGHICLIYQ